MQAVATVAAHHAIQFPGMFARSASQIQPIKRNVRPTYKNQVHDTILRCTCQMSGVQSEQLKANFLAGVEVSEISTAQWIAAAEEFHQVWFV